MDARAFEECLNSGFYTGVPDSLLRPFCDCLVDKYGISEKHIVAANEGNAVGLAAGYYMSTQKIPVVYLQNSGLGNIVNPVASLLNEKVYGIPCVFVVGWRGEPGVYDEPQHIFQGEITLQLLRDLDIETMVIDSETALEKVADKLAGFTDSFVQGKSLAFVVRKGALTYEHKVKYQNENVLLREEIIRCIVKTAGDDMLVSTTGKASRELFEIREANGQPHGNDFLTVGSMGHSSSIALSVALQKKDKRIWCIDGDGAALMHMGALAVIGTMKPANLIHVVINNGAHETVGGIPTAAGNSAVQLTDIAKACGYPNVYCVGDASGLHAALKAIRGKHQLCFLEVKAAIGAREDLGRPTTSAQENVKTFMKTLQK